MTFIGFKSMLENRSLFTRSLFLTCNISAIFLIISNDGFVLLVQHLLTVAISFSICFANHFAVLCCSTSKTFNLFRSLFAIVQNIVLCKVLNFFLDNSNKQQKIICDHHFLCFLAQFTNHKPDSVSWVSIQGYSKLLFHYHDIKLA